MDHAHLPIRAEVAIRDCTEDDLAALIWYSRGGVE